MDESAARTGQVARLVIVEFQGADAVNRVRFCSERERSSRTRQEWTGRAVSETSVDDGFSDLDGRGTLPDRKEIVVEHVAERFWKPVFATAIDIAILIDLAV